VSASESHTGVAIRRMVEADVEAVLRVDQAAYEFPWSASVFRDCLRMDYDASVQLVAEQVVGHSVLACAAGEGHVLNLAVHPESQSQGHGRRLLERALRQAWRLGAEAVFLEVRPSNQPALRLYRSCGFVRVGRRRDYFPTLDSREDALVMRCAADSGVPWR